MWKWDQAAGKLYHDDEFVTDGYSGADRGKNNPALQNAIGLGPIPQGNWRMTGMYKSVQTGPVTIALAPEPGTNTFGRSAFRIHGDSIVNPGSASHGCIILPRQIRQEMWDSGDHALIVVE